MTIHHPDGTVDTQRAYTPRQLAAIDNHAARQPRTWNEVNSRKGGGTDFGQKR